MLRLGAPFKVGDVPGEDNRYFYQPRGVALVIAPWNFPLAISTGMTAAALVAGNTVLYKPSSLSPVNGWQLFSLLQEAGVPDGVVNFIPGRGDAVGGWLAEHPEIDLIAFTGSREVGLGLIERAARRAPGARSVKRVIAEMGGKNAMIVDADADLDQAVAGVLQSAFGYQGQKCSACSRVIVLAGCYERFLERLTEAVKGIRVGPPEDPACFMGPLIEAGARERVERYIALAATEGRIAVRGDAPTGECYVPPVVVTDLPSSSAVLREEIFGPLLAVIKAKDMAEALAIANDSDYALTGGLFSRSPSNIRAGCARIRRGEPLHQPWHNRRRGRPPAVRRLQDVGSGLQGWRPRLPLPVPRAAGGDGKYHAPRFRPGRAVVILATLRTPDCCVSCVMSCMHQKPGRPTASGNTVNVYGGLATREIIPRVSRVAVWQFAAGNGQSGRGPEFKRRISASRKSNSCFVLGVQRRLGVPS